MAEFHSMYCDSKYHNYTERMGILMAYQVLSPMAGAGGTILGVAVQFYSLVTNVLIPIDEINVEVLLIPSKSI